MSSVTMVKFATATCYCCGAEIKYKVSQTIQDDEELDSTIVILEKLYLESGSHICEKCKSKIKS